MTTIKVIYIGLLNKSSYVIKTSVRLLYLHLNKSCWWCRSIAKNYISNQHCYVDRNFPKLTWTERLPYIHVSVYLFVYLALCMYVYICINIFVRKTRIPKLLLSWFKKCNLLFSFFWKKGQKDTSHTVCLTWLNLIQKINIGHPSTNQEKARSSSGSKTPIVSLRKGRYAFESVCLPVSLQKEPKQPFNGQYQVQCTSLQLTF